MTKQFTSGYRLGILGGGQLGRMLIQACIDYNIHTSVLDPDVNAPCRNLCNAFVQGSFNDYENVLAFGRTVDLLTIEIEHVNVDALEQLVSEGIAVYPQPHIIRMVQDKGLQKQFYKGNGFPTSDFVFFEGVAELRSHIDFLPAFQKTRLAGYDGKGVKSIRTEKDIPQLLEGPSLLEKAVPFAWEVSVIAARNAKGEIKTFPLVLMVADDEKNLLDYLMAPADDFLPPAAVARAYEIGRTLPEKLGIVGLLAIELFVTAEGEVYVNEIAPRPHNSGHHTIEANYTSQYAMHIRAISGWPLGDTAAHGFAGMVNLLGEEGHDGKAVCEGWDEVMAMPEAFIHLYGKMYTREGRKMGHVTLLGEDAQTLAEKIHYIKNTLKIIAE